MNDEDKPQWLRERMQKQQQRQEAAAPTFGRVWRAARALQVPRETWAGWPSWRLASVSIAAAAVAAIVAMHTVAEREETRQKERDFAVVDGVLMTYWQAPSDDLLPIGNGMKLPNE